LVLFLRRRLFGCFVSRFGFGAFMVKVAETSAEAERLAPDGFALAVFDIMPFAFCFG